MSYEPDPRELFSRVAGNPILTASDFPKMVNAVFNPGAAVVDGKTLLLLRVEHRTGLSSLAVVTSEDGLTGWQVDLTRGLEPLRECFEEHWGVEDPRITQIGSEYFVVYTGYSTSGPLVCLAKTRDFVRWERYGALMAPEDKDAALFPAEFGGRFALLHRPVQQGPWPGAHIWLTYSPDLRHWGEPLILLAARQGGWWDAHRVGIGPPPLLTPDGWLLCYHGVRHTASGSIYRLGLALLDKDDPATVLARGQEWVFGPREPYERQGDVPSAVFPCGWILRDDGDTLHIYYGAADSVVCMAEASLSALLAHLEKHPSPPGTAEHPPSARAFGAPSR